MVDGFILQRVFLCGISTSDSLSLSNWCQNVTSDFLPVALYTCTSDIRSWPLAGTITHFIPGECPQAVVALFGF